MKNLFSIAFSFAFVLTSSPTLGGDGKKPTDYKLYDHEAEIDVLRSGNHDESGVNQYFFVHTLIALLNTKEELKKDLPARKKITNDGVKFGEISIDVLTQWQPDEKGGNNLAVKIEGNTIRKLISDAMRQFNVSEKDVALMAEIEMFEKEKFLGYFGEDRKIGKITYFPIPPTSYQLGGRVNTKLSLTDDKGTDVRIKVTYATPLVDSPKQVSVESAKP